MTIVVFTRSTPDTAAKVEVDASGSVTWGEAATVVNPWDEYALEEAILQGKAGGGKTVVAAVGPEMHNEALKHSLAMGLDEAARVWDEALQASDSLGYAAAAAAAVQKIGDVSLVILGKESVDVGTDQHNTQIARRLGWPMLSYVSRIVAVDYAAKTIKVERLLEEGKQVVTSRLPAVIGTVKDINEPRYVSFMGIRKAAKAVIPMWSAADLGCDPAKIGQAGSAMSWPEIKPLPARQGSVELIEGSPEEIAAKLADKLFGDKVI